MPPASADVVLPVTALEFRVRVPALLNTPPPGWLAKATSAPITTAALSTDFLVFIDPLPSLDCAISDHKNPTPVSTNVTDPLIRAGHNRRAVTDLPSWSCIEGQDRARRATT